MATHKRASRIKLTAAITAVAAAAGVTVFGTSFAGAATPAEGTVYGANAEGAVAGSYIVMLDKKADKQDLAKEYGGKLQRNYSSAINGFSASGLSETEAKRLAADPAVAKVVQNKKFSINATQDDPPSWGLDRIDQADTAGDKKYTYPDSAGEGVTAYVIDTGVRISHKDFGGRAAHGFDAVDNDDSADDGNGHGTHVAGTIAGTAHGVAKKAKVVAVRVLDDNGSGTTEQVVAGIDWVTKNHQGPSVANMSLGGGADEALDEAVRKAIASGVTFAVAAGNESSDASQGSPARVKEAITVAGRAVGVLQLRRDRGHLRPGLGHHLGVERQRRGHQDHLRHLHGDPARRRRRGGLPRRPPGRDPGTGGQGADRRCHGRQDHQPQRGHAQQVAEGRRVTDGPRR